MPSLRDMIDGKTLDGGIEAASPLAKHVAKNIQDPIGQTKDDFSDLTKKMVDYNVAKENMKRKLLPVQSVLDHVNQMHQFDPLAPQPLQDPMQGDPNDPNAANPNMDEQGNPPANMNQTVGKMNQSRPSQVGNQPGVAPGDGQTVRPPKLGMAKPGGPAARNSPAPGNAQGNTYSKTAKPPKGSKTIPGAKGPGDPKVANKVKKAQSSTTGRQIKVNVTAAASYSNLESSLSLGTLKSDTPAIPVGTVRAGAAQANDKVDDSGDAVAYNPVIRGKKKVKAGGPGSGRRPNGSVSNKYRNNWLTKTPTGKTKGKPSNKKIGPVTI